MSPAARESALRSPASPAYRLHCHSDRWSDGPVRAFSCSRSARTAARPAILGDAQGVSNLEAPTTVRLEEAWLQQNLFANRLSWLVGRFDLNAEFYRLQSGALFINSSLGIGPEFSHSGIAGPSIFPNTTAGTRLEYKPARNVAWRAAALDGPMFISEVALLRRGATAGLPRERRFGIGRGLARSYAAKSDYASPCRIERADWTSTTTHAASTASDR